MASLKTRLITASIKNGLLVVTGYSLFFLIFFSPVLFSDRLLAPGDGISYFIPNFYSRTMLWDLSIWAGFPSIGDPQRMFWYPPALLLAWVPNSWNIFMLSAYILAGSFTYGYAFSMTRSRLAAAASGLIYSLSGFMIAHIGHAAMVHTTLWLPLILWAYSELARRETINRFWFTVATAAVACTVLAGHPQMACYVLVLSSLFVLVTGLTATIGTSRFYLACGTSFIIGLGVSMVQTVPSIEMAPHTLRASLTFQEFTAYQLPIRQLPMVLFPYLYGGSPLSFYQSPYFGAWPSSGDGWGASELTGYVGILPLMLAGIGLVQPKRNITVWFWLAVAFLSLMLVVGESTPLAVVTYHIPILNLFRAPARHFFAFAFAISILAGFGVSSLMKRLVTKQLLLTVVLVTGTIIVGILIASQLFASKINELAQQRLGHLVSLNPFTNPSLLLPVAIFLSVTLALFFFRRNQLSPLAGALLLLLLIVDLGSFAWFYEWRYRSPYKEYLHAPAASDAYRAQLEQNHQRVLPVRGGLGRVSELPPDLSKLWNIPSASGYGPLVLTRLNRLLSMQPHGSIDDTWHEPANQSLDLLGVKYALVSESEDEPLPQTDERGLRWSTRDSNMTIGQGCDRAAPLSLEIDLQGSRPATRLAIVGTLACSLGLENGVEFAQLTVTDTSGHEEVHSLRAGKDFSEWAWDCSDVRPIIRHQRAVVFSSRAAERGGAIRCEAHDYVAFFSLGQVKAAAKISFRWTGPPATFAIRKITTIDDDGRVSTPVPLDSQPLLDETRWMFRGKIDQSNAGYSRDVTAQDIGVANVYENLRARPRAWLVPEVLHVSEQDAANAILTSKLPDNRSFTLADTALVEVSPPTFEPGDIAFIGSAHVTSLTNEVMEVQTSSNTPAFLVTSDLYYPGWQASIDGNPSTIYQTDYLLRGVVVPAGPHSVRFEFRPRSFYLGLTLSSAFLLLLILVVVWPAIIKQHS